MPPLIRLLLYISVLMFFASLAFGYKSDEEEIIDFMVEEALPLPPPKMLDSIRPKDLISVDEYCLCQCIKKGQDPKKAKIFKGKKKHKSCLCECQK